MKPVVKRKPKKDPAFGTVAFIEHEGSLRLNCDVCEVDGTAEEIIMRIRAAVTGMAYMWEHNEDEIVETGKAFIQGMETGIEMANKAMKKKPKDDSGPGNIGFRAKHDG